MCIIKIVLLLFTIAQSQNLVKSRKLQLVHIIFRHGARYPMFPNNVDGSNTSVIDNLAGQLTLQGKKMHYILGKILAKRYITQLFENQSREEIFKQTFVRSTNFNRTLLSAQAHLKGWLSELKQVKGSIQKVNCFESSPFYQNIESIIQSQNLLPPSVNSDLEQTLIPIHVEQVMLDHQTIQNVFISDSLLQQSPTICPRQITWKQQNWSSELASKIKNNLLVKQSLMQLSKYYKQDIKIDKVGYLIDNYKSLKYMNKPYLPIFQHQNHKKTFDFLLKMNLYLTMYGNQIQRKAMLSPLILDIWDKIKQVKSKDVKKDTKQPKIKRLNIYSAHQTTIANILNGMNFTSAQCIAQQFLQHKNNYNTCYNHYPEYAAHIVFQIYREDDQKLSIEIKINGNQSVMLPFCNYSSTCSLDKFQQWFERFVTRQASEICKEEIISSVSKVQMNISFDKSNYSSFSYKTILIALIMSLAVNIWFCAKKYFKVQALNRQNVKLSDQECENYEKN